MLKVQNWILGHMSYSEQLLFGLEIKKNGDTLSLDCCVKYSKNFDHKKTILCHIPLIMTR